MKFGAERIQGLKNSQWNVGVLGGGLRESKGTLGPQHSWTPPQYPSCSPLQTEARKEERKRRKRERDTQEVSHCPHRAASDPRLNPPSKQCGFRPDQTQPPQAALGLAEQALSRMCLQMPAPAWWRHLWELTSHVLREGLSVSNAFSRTCHMLGASHFCEMEFNSS